MRIMNNKKTAGIAATVGMIIYVICTLTDGGAMP